MYTQVSRKILARLVSGGDSMNDGNPPGWYFLITVVKM